MIDNHSKNCKSLLLISIFFLGLVIITSSYVKGFRDCPEQQVCSLESELCAGSSCCCEGLKCNSNGVCEKIVGAEICNNRVDDDGNGYTDCLDPKCKSTTSCGGYDDTSVVNNRDNQSSGLVIALIIGISIIIGFIILAIILVKLLKKKKSRK